MVCLSSNSTITSAALSPERILDILFPHSWDWIRATKPPKGQKPQWRTITTYPLTSSLALRSGDLIGVGFGKTTKYFVLDVDKGSPYHPDRDPSAFARILETTKLLGFKRYIITRSSDSGGLHVYFYFNQPQTSYEIGQAVTQTLIESGIPVKGGELEVFPNARLCTGKIPALYNRHRMPCQEGSYILNEDLQPVSNDLADFYAAAELCKQENKANTRVIRRIARKYQTLRRHVSAGVDEVLEDRYNSFAPGWTGKGQTNDRVRDIAYYVFIYGEANTARELDEAGRIAEGARIARSLPGFYEHCGHVKDIEKRLRDWDLKYQRAGNYHHSRRGSKTAAERALARIDCSVNKNLLKSESARAKIVSAVKDLWMVGSLPEAPTARRQKLQTYGISSETLYKHSELWHPDSMTIPIEALESLLAKESSDVEKFGRVNADLKSLEAAPDKKSSDVCDTKCLKPFSSISSSCPQRHEEEEMLLLREQKLDCDENRLEGVLSPAKDESIRHNISEPFRGNSEGLENAYTESVSEADQTRSVGDDRQEPNNDDLDPLEQVYLNMADLAKAEGRLDRIYFSESPVWNCWMVIPIKNAPLPLIEWGDRESARIQKLPIAASESEVRARQQLKQLMARLSLKK